MQKGISKMSNKIIMDTNVAAKAATPIKECKEEELDLQQECMAFIKRFVDNPDSKLVLDADYEISKEYRNRISMNTTVGKIFWRWFNLYLKRIAAVDFVKLEKDTAGNHMMFPMEKEQKSLIPATGSLSLWQEHILNILRLLKLQMQSGWVTKMYLKNTEYILNFWIWNMQK